MIQLFFSSFFAFDALKRNSVVARCEGEGGMGQAGSCFISCTRVPLHTSSSLGIILVQQFLTA